MNDQDVQKARAVSLHRLLGIKESGRRLSVRCVFHKDNRPSLCIYPGDGGYHCFSCGKNGHNAIDFVMDLGYTFKDAVKELTNVQ